MPAKRKEADQPSSSKPTKSRPDVAARNAANKGTSLSAVQCKLNRWYRGPCPEEAKAAFSGLAKDVARATAEAWLVANKYVLAILDDELSLRDPARRPADGPSTALAAWTKAFFYRYGAIVRQPHVLLPAREHSAARAKIVPRHPVGSH